MIRIMISCLTMNGVFALYNFFGPGWVAYGKNCMSITIGSCWYSRNCCIYCLYRDMQLRLPKELFSYISLKGMCNRLLRRGAR